MKGKLKKREKKGMMEMKDKGQQLPIATFPPPLTNYSIILNTLGDSLSFLTMGDQISRF